MQNIWKQILFSEIQIKVYNFKYNHARKFDTCKNS